MSYNDRIISDDGRREKGAHNRDRNLVMVGV